MSIPAVAARESAAQRGPKPGGVLVGRPASHAPAVAAAAAAAAGVLLASSFAFLAARSPSLASGGALRFWACGLAAGVGVRSTAAALTLRGGPTLWLWLRAASF